ncbi:GLE1-like protein-domain-containing protein [Bombardia bombarda]|uniref:mRNA export factor GLE1 n=1 Tax=Bombardia bombarda TaxID=252184 RepID=A0AA39XNJ6_9PEZI|nr:GLE1-like protein-domain-containing protein [Bombardia bombarda]
MAESSLARPSQRRSYQWASPARSVISDILSEDRNSEARHRLLIEAAKREHDRVREEAERVYHEHLKREEKQQILDEKRKEEDRIRLEEQIAAERTRLNALRAKKVNIPPVAPEPEAPKPPPAPSATPPAPAPTNATPPATSSQVNGTTAQTSAIPAPKSSPFLAPIQGNKQQLGAQPTASSPLAAGTPPVPATQTLTGAPKPSLFPSGAVQNNGASSSSPAVIQPPAQAATPAGPDRYTVIHNNLKALRKSMVVQAETNRALKATMGDMRREIRKSVGQLTGGAGGVNRMQQQKMNALLREALENRVQCQLIDASNFVVDTTRPPAQGARRNDAALPSLFLYLLNIFSKAVISQFINEAGARPETADPVGVCVAGTFSEPDFLWRGISLIDILMAKFRIVCPVLFGYRGNEKMQQGRQRIGWWKENGTWVTEQQHMDRMTGLGAGYAAIALRKFGGSKKENPYPPRNYWTAMAKIVNTPADDISNTQCVVLKSMIQNYEQRFIEFYGTAALAALRTALLEFPTRAPQKSAAVNSLEVLALSLKRDTGLVLG